ncbi:MAG TPA: UDP-N-acetylmuramoyl-L-alanine--D-glutamate ligase [Burkholderiaceae bacterium]|jgi:UDP-N-acetylmuramoylalanine--D-glutamate ligase|nr:UDP-N-acetylmuramoyl-L-alanine--D-glutamate ligase [Burkholderiaceae bacterium]
MDTNGATTVLVLGLGASGLAMARWCARQGARVHVWDSRAAPPQASALAADVPTATLFTGELTRSALDGIACVYKSPGLSPHDERLRALLAVAASESVPVRGELDLFAQALADLRVERGYAPRVLAITGTNGKTTTTALTGLLVARAGRRVAVAGNIGPTLLDTLAAAIAAQEQDDAEVAAAAEQAEAEARAAAEVDAEAGAAEAASAAQALDGTDAASVDAQADADADEPIDAVIRPDVPEALETGEVPVSSVEDDLAESEADAPLPSVPPLAMDEADERTLPILPPPPPAPVFSRLPEIWVLELSSFQLEGVQGFEPDAATVLNLTQDHLDWHATMAAYAEAKARIFGARPEARTVLVVNRDDPAVVAMVPAPVALKGAPRSKARTLARRVVQFGLDAPRAPGDFGIVVENGMAWLVRALERDVTIKSKPGEVEEIVLQRLMPADALRIRGRHNAANALAALALATSIGLPLAPMLHGLREYRGEPHRVAPVGHVGAIEFFDDSKGTNVGATVAALEGLGADRAPARLVVILGGDGKGQAFEPLTEPLRRHARAVATIGRDAERIEAVARSASVPFTRHATLEDATRWAHAEAEAGDAVLLSPACASFDMFRDYAHRAEVFVDTVHRLAAAHGEVLR